MYEGGGQLDVFMSGGWLTHPMCRSFFIIHSIGQALLTRTHTLAASPRDAVETCA